MKDVLIQIFGSLIAYIIIQKISINLIGLVVRGFIEDLSMIPDDTSPQVIEAIKKESGIKSRGGIIMTIISIILTIAFFYALYHYWNIGLVVISVLQMVSYLPDLLWRIKSGKRISKTNMPPSLWKLLSNIGILIMLLCLPLTWYCLFRLS